MSLVNTVMGVVLGFASGCVIYTAINYGRHDYDILGAPFYCLTGGVVGAYGGAFIGAVSDPIIDL